MTLPLTNVKILDLGDEPVAFASRLLAGLGADVVRVEQPSGDWLRKRGPFVHDEPGLERGLAHFLNNAGKRSVLIDLEAPGEQVQLRQLVAKAAVVIAPLDTPVALEGLLARGSFERDFPAVGLIQPVFRRNVAASATDLTAVAAGGQLYLNGDPADPPNYPAGNLAYKQLSLAAALAAVALVLEGAAGRPPGRVEISMQEAIMWTTIQSANENYAFWERATPERHGIGSVSGQTIFITRDGKYVSLYHHPPAFLPFARWYAELFGDDQYAQPPWDDDLYRLKNGDQITAITQRACLAMDREDLIAEAQKRSILCVPVQDVSDIAVDPHLREREFFQTVRVNQLDEDLELIRLPFVTSSYQASAAAPPALGEHTGEVFREWLRVAPERQDVRS